MPEAEAPAVPAPAAPVDIEVLRDLLANARDPLLSDWMLGNWVRTYLTGLATAIDELAEAAGQ